jgi:hypothetical protein
VLGNATVVEDVASKRVALKAFTDKLLAGRWGDARPPTDNELAATSVLRLPLDEFSAKIRTGPPVDKEEDMALPVWAGVLPLRVVAGAPIPDDANDPNRVPPGYARFGH